MMYADYIQAYRDLLTQLSCIKYPRDVSFTSFKAAVTSLDPDLPLSDRDTALSVALSALTEHVVFTCRSTKYNIYKMALLATLADATRQNPIWRSLFGPVEGSDDKSTTCILDVAQEIIAECLFQYHRQELESALRLVANCCADNNLNRKHFLTRNGVSQLVDHYIQKRLSTLLIPTIYNVCNDYEEPDTEVDQPSISSQNQSESGAPAMTLSLAARELATVCAERADFSTFELLLAPSARPEEEQQEYLAALVELAALPATEGMNHIFGGRAANWQWSFSDQNETVLTLEAANELADENAECRMSVLRAILYVLSQDEAKKALLKRHDDSILQLVKLGSVYPQRDHTEDLKEEIKACHKEFFKLFYELTGTSVFSEDEEANMALATICLDTLYISYWKTEETFIRPQEAEAQLAGPDWMYARTDASTGKVNVQERPWKPLFVKICALIILAQLSIHDPIRQMLLNSTTFLDIIKSTVQESSNPDVLYPTITLVARLLMSPKASLVLGSADIPRDMKRLIAESGLGLIIPYETVNVYRLLFKGRPKCLTEYTQDSLGRVDLRTEPGDPWYANSITSTIASLFDRTFEAGTKLAVGHFFIEVLRTVFPSVKHLDDVESETQSTNIANAFSTFLDTTAGKVGEILSFVCTQAEPKEQRVHGWFGLGMLSVWSQGRSAIVDAIEHHGLDQGILEVSRASEGPASQNLKLVLSKMQQCPRETLPKKTMQCLDEAARNLNMTVTTT